MARQSTKAPAQHTQLSDMDRWRLQLEKVRAEKVKRVLEKQGRELAERSEEIKQNSKTLLGFIAEAWHVLEPTQPYVCGLPIEAMAEHLEGVHFGYITRLLTNVPPASMKSMLHGVFFPAWEWGPQAKPSTRYIGTAHNLDLATRDSLKFKKLVESEWYQGLWGDRVVRSTPWGDTEIANKATGFRKATAFTAITGERANRVIVDDPLSVSDADSKTIREKVLKLFKESVPTRLNNRHQDAIMVVMQRLHENDIAGYITKHLKDQYTTLILPMEYEPARKCYTMIGGKQWCDPRTVEGELLFPARFDAKTLAEDKITMGQYAIAGQYQQNPVPREGGLVKASWTQARVRQLPPNCLFVRAWDFASTEKKQGIDPDATASCLMAKTPDGRYIICNVTEDWWLPAEVEEQLVQKARADGQNVKVRYPQDPAQAGKYQAQAFGRALAGFMFAAVSPSGDKERRAQPLASQFRLGNVALLETGNAEQDAWIDNFLEQLHIFPAGAHDDMVDAAADAFIELAGGMNGMGYFEFIKAQALGQQTKAEGAAQQTVEQIGMRPPHPYSIAYAKSGKAYHPDARGIFIVDLPDVAGFEGQGWIVVQ